MDGARQESGSFQILATSARITCSLFMSWSTLTKPFMNSITIQPVDRTPTFVYVCFYLIQFMLNAMVRITVINPGIYIGFTLPPASSAPILKAFVHGWNLAMVWVCPALALCIVATIFGLYAFLSYARLSGVRGKVSALSGFRIGVFGLLMPAAASSGIAWVTHGHPEMALAPAAVNLIVFWQFSRRAMWRQFNRIGAADRRKLGK